MTADMLKRLVPGSFPGTLMGLVQDPNSEGEVVINPGYRKYSTASKNKFHYFVTRMLPSTNPKKLSCGKERRYKPISEMISVLDKAFALLLLYNEHHIWMDNMRNGDELVDSEDEGISNTRKKRKRKQFCDQEKNRVGKKPNISSTCFFGKEKKQVGKKPS